MATAVVPVEAGGVDTGGETFIEDAFQIVDFAGVSVIFAGGVDFLEKVGWRHLFGVADDDELFTAGDHADSVPDGDLRSFVEYDN